MRAKVPMNRRDFLRTAGALPFLRPLALGGSITIATTRPAHSWVMIALGVVQLGLQVAKMFGPKGPNLSDLLNLQTDLLVNISQQINVLHQQVELLFQRLEEIKEMIGEVPHKTVIDLYRTKTSAQLRNFTQMMELFALEQASKKDIETSKRAVAATLRNQVLPVLIESRLAFSVERNVALLPLMAEALQAEVMSMVMLGKEAYSDNAIRIVLREYARWFRSWLDPQNQQNLPEQCRTLIAEISKGKQESDQGFLKYTGWTCLRNGQLIARDSAAQYITTFDVDTVFLSDELEREFAMQMMSFRREGIIIPESLDNVNSRKVNITTQNYTDRYSKFYELGLKIESHQGESPMCDKQMTPPAKIKAMYESWNGEFGLKGEKLLSYLSLMLVASSSRLGCEKFYAGLD